MESIELALTRLYVAVWLRTRDEHGDVPGWVMITVMTAGLVGILSFAAKGRLLEMFNAAMDQVSGN